MTLARTCRARADASATACPHPATECHIDGYYPLGTDHCVMVVKDEHDRILMTHEAASEHGDDAEQFLQP